MGTPFGARGSRHPMSCAVATQKPSRLPPASFRTKGVVPQARGDVAVAAGRGSLTFASSRASAGATLAGNGESGSA